MVMAMITYLMIVAFPLTLLSLSYSKQAEVLSEKVAKKRAIKTLKTKLKTLDELYPNDSVIDGYDDTTSFRHSEISRKESALIESAFEHESTPEDHGPTLNDDQGLLLTNDQGHIPVNQAQLLGNQGHIPGNQAQLPGNQAQLPGNQAQLHTIVTGNEQKTVVDTSSVSQFEQDVSAKLVARKWRNRMSSKGSVPAAASPLHEFTHAGLSVGAFNDVSRLNLKIVDWSYTMGPNKSPRLSDAGYSPLTSGSKNDEMSMTIAIRSSDQVKKLLRFLQELE